MTEPKTWTYDPDPDESGVPYSFEHGGLLGLASDIEYDESAIPPFSARFQRFQHFEIATVDVRPRWRRVLDEAVRRIRHAVAALRGSSGDCEW